MKIGITTCWQSSDNYGQQLQCWALQRYLEHRGHEPFLIRYAPVGASVGLVRRVWDALKYRMRTPKETVRRAHENAALYQQNAALDGQRMFGAFRSQHLRSTPVVYHSVEELRAQAPEADAYITGSDQVWHDAYDDPNIAGWFLDFGGKEVKRISYAASIGRELSEADRQTLRGYLRRFDHVSVREESVRDLCRSLGIEPVSMAIDPTLLLDVSDYGAIEADGHNETSSPYAFVYAINVQDEKDAYLDIIGPALKAQGLEMKAVASSGYLPARPSICGQPIIRATIPEWLSLVKNASVVLTTSFHGVVFSLLYHRPFYAFLLAGEFAKANDRIFTLLNRLGLAHRIIDSVQAAESLPQEPIAWDEVDRRLDEYRQQSMTFLEEAL